MIPSFPLYDAETRERLLNLRRYDAAKHAMMGLLADHKDHEDERRHIVVKENPCHAVGTVIEEAVTSMEMRKDDGSFGTKIIYNVTRQETCAEAVARLAVEHGDALLARLEVKS